MELTTVWFIAIAVLWVGYLVLEGFDFGVGLHMQVTAHDDRERRVLLNTIGPVWDANEVWLIVAAGATFAAFPDWYAAMFSGFYLPLLLILLALIVRIVGIEFRAKRPDLPWRQWCDRAIAVGSIAPPFLWGMILAAMVAGTPIDAGGDHAGGLGDLLDPYALLGGAVILGLSAVHGAFFIGLKTTGSIRGRVLSWGLRYGAAVGVLTTVFVAWTVARDLSWSTLVIGTATIAAFAAAGIGGVIRRDGWAFAGTAATMGLLVTLLFVGLFPDVMPSSLDPAWSLTTESAASSPYTLTILTWVAAAFLPIVVGYQAWSYWVFRRRIGVQHIPVS